MRYFFISWHARTDKPMAGGNIMLECETLPSYENIRELVPANQEHSSAKFIVDNLLEFKNKQDCADFIVGSEIENLE